jgi:hypothetical protein
MRQGLANFAWAGFEQQFFQSASQIATITGMSYHTWFINILITKERKRH